MNSRHSCLRKALGNHERARVLYCLPVAIGCILGILVLTAKGLIDTLTASLTPDFSTDPAAIVGLCFGILELTMAIVCIVALCVPRNDGLNIAARLCFMALITAAVTTIIVDLVFFFAVAGQSAASIIVLVVVMIFNCFIVCTGYEFASAFASLSMVVKAGGTGYEGRDYNNVHLSHKTPTAKSHFVDDNSSI